MFVGATHITPAILWAASIEYTHRGLRLHTVERIPLQHSESPMVMAHTAIRQWVSTLPALPKELRVALSPELAALLHTFPIEADAANIQSLPGIAEFELQQFLTDYDRQHYATFILPLGAGKRAPLQGIAITYNRNEIELLRAHCLPDTPTTLIMPDLFAIPPLWRYTYPDLLEERVVLLHVQPPYLDTMVLAHGCLATFRTVPLEEAPPLAMAQQCAQYLTEFLSDDIPQPATVFVFGQAVSSALIASLQENLAQFMKQPPLCRRLNPFRMCLPPNDRLQREYAIRTAHLFWGCVGVCLPVEAGLIHF
ncbi:MAG: hypothetical protein RMK93_04195 [Bacteroidota bacterium]|nr:hypothetical protein [Bacteroidota bacterium]